MHVCNQRVKYDSSQWNAYCWLMWLLCKMFHRLLFLTATIPWTIDMIQDLNLGTAILTWLTEKLKSWTLWYINITQAELSHDTMTNSLPNELSINIYMKKVARSCMKYCDYIAYKDQLTGSWCWDTCSDRIGHWFKALQVPKKDNHLHTQTGETDHLIGQSHILDQLLQ